MELIVGGRNQGKLKYAMDKHKVSKDEVFFAENEDLWETDGKILYGFSFLVKKWIKQELDISEETNKLKFEIIISDEVGSGIVPMDNFERQWREETGRACCILAKKAERVTRVFCGIPTVIK